jgi:hypothetical protein
MLFEYLIDLYLFSVLPSLSDGIINDTRHADGGQDDADDLEKLHCPYF